MHAHALQVLFRARLQMANFIEIHSQAYYKIRGAEAAFRLKILGVLPPGFLLPIDEHGIYFTCLKTKRVASS